MESRCGDGADVMMDPNKLLANSVSIAGSLPSPDPQHACSEVDLAPTDSVASVANVQFQVLFERSSDAMLLIRDDGIYLDLNPAACHLFGLSKQAFLAQKPVDFVKLGASFQQTWSQVQPDEPIKGELRLPAPDGTFRDLEYTGIANVAPSCHLAIVREVSECRQAELNTQRSVQQARLISAISQNIRQSLSLNYILSTTVEEMQQFLQVDRVVIFRFNPDGSGKVVAEALEDETFSIIHQTIHDPRFTESRLDFYQQGSIHAIDDISTASSESCYLELLTDLQVRAVLAIPILIRQSLWGLLVAHQCTSPRHWQEINWHLLQQFSTQVSISIHQAELYQQTQHQAQRENLLNRVTQAIRHSLDLSTIFSTAVTEIGKTLRVDRSSIVQYLPDRNLWRTVASHSKDLALANPQRMEIPDEGNPLAAQLKQFQLVRLDDASLCTDKINQRIAQTFSGAWLLVPLQIDLSTVDTQSRKIWGSLSLFKTHPTDPWQDSEVELASAIAEQLAIAIQQSELFQQVQQLNQQLGKLVQEQTAQLQKALEFEALLKRITDNVRDSLDERQILQTVVQELVLGLAISGCDVALYDLEQEVFTIHYEYLTKGIPSAQGCTVPANSISDIFAQLSQGETFQFCELVVDPVRPLRQVAILSCPIVDDQNVLGDLWLFRQCEDVFSSEEIRLVQQVANQCAIGMRQARLYQAAQAQVNELERLNQLKDDFLSTVSHELRSPIASIKMATQMLEISLTKLGVLGAEPTPVSRYVQILQDECQREIHLVNDLLDLCRLDAGQELMFPTQVDLTTWIPAMSSPFIERAQNRQQHLVIDVPAQLPALVTDISALDRIMAELLTNACKYTPPGETISLSVRSRDQMMQISVSNSGVELPTQELSRIFDKFYRIPNSDPWKHGGTGLGLALVKKLADKLGASIQASSSAGNTTFTLLLPVIFAGEAGDGSEAGDRL